MNINKKINAAVIGLGVGLHHAKYYDSDKRVNLKYVVDFDSSKREIAKKIFPKVKILEFYNSVIDDPELDIISVASYDNYHFEQIIKAINNNVNLFVEKPICQTKSELSAIFSLYKKSNLVMKSNFPLRTTPRFIDLKKKINNGFFGNILSLNLNYFWGRKEKLLYGWRRKVHNYSIIKGGMIHMLDLAFYLLKEWPVEIIGTSSNKGFDEYKEKGKRSFYDNAVVFLKYKDGKIVNCRVDSLSCHPHFHEVQIHGTKKSYISTISQSFFVNSSNEQDINTTLDTSSYPSRENRYKLIKTFIDEVINENPKINYYLYNLMKLVFCCEDAVKNSTNIKFKARCND